MRFFIRLLLAGVSVWVEPSISFAQQNQFVTSDGLRLRYVDVGKGEPVVLVHGAGNSIETWVDRQILPELAKSYRVIAFDARGHGNSDNPTRIEQFTQRAMVTDLVALLDHLKLAKAHIVGYSMGGGVVTRLLAERPERFLTASIIASDLNFDWTPEDAQRARADLKQATAAREKACVGGEVTRACAYTMRTVGLVTTREDTVLGDAAFARLRLPVLGIVGTDDPNIRSMRALKEAITSMTYVEVAGATHGGEKGILGRPETLTELGRFLARRPSS